MTDSALLALVAAAGLGGDRAAWLIGALDLDRSLLAPPAGGWVPRRVVAQALGALLLDDLLGRVPSGAAYVSDKRARGEKVHLDHGALRSVTGVPCGSLPPGEAAVTRALSALGYRHQYTYDLARLGMTGRSWCHLDLPAAIPQYFVSEFHAERLPGPLREAAARVLGPSRDPLDAVAQARLRALSAGGGLGFDEAAALLPALVACFRRHHPAPTLADYEALLGESAEMAWIATEGTVCNHMADRVGDVAAVAAAERAVGRPIKDTVEVSASGRILQTAHRAAVVARDFGLPRRGHGVAPGCGQFLRVHHPPAAPRWHRDRPGVRRGQCPGDLHHDPTAPGRLRPGALGSFGKGDRFAITAVGWLP